MEVFRTEDFYIFVKNQHSLWWDRQTATFIPKTGWDLTDADDPVCLGVCYGLIGKVEHPSVFDPRLIIIRDCAPVGKLHGDNEVFKIRSIAFLHLSRNNTDVNLHTCPKHKAMPASGRKLGASLPFMDMQKNAMSKTLGGLKTAGNVIKNTTQQAAAMAAGAPLRGIRSGDVKDKEKFEKQIMEEFHKIFTDTNSFYFCQTSDITNSLQRLGVLDESRKSSVGGEVIDAPALWRTVDDRFFWNKHMLSQLIELNNDLCNPWIQPIIQGYIQIEECKVKMDDDLRPVNNSSNYEIFKLCIISRRSRFRAGTRYKRRGVDELGECANYVETEQLIAYQHHEVSFVQVRGSVPVFWSQPGYKYRPPPKIDKGEAETKEAFEKHFDQELTRYGPVCVVNLVDQTGKEKVIWDAYSHHIFEYNSPQVTYVTFDFHEYCRGMHFENVTILINSIADIIKDMGYSWRDRHGVICTQVGVFRVNCIDCLDRTNVVQTALAKSVMELQFCKLGLIAPEGQIPDSIKGTFQLLWANNGDTISKQYAGTNALKGDYTRTGERKFTGIMKDGMNSANRFYRSHFLDALRQCALDLLLGQCHEQMRPDDVLCAQAPAKVVGSIAGELLLPTLSKVHGDTMMLLPHSVLQQEYELANAFYHMCRYYLSRFKDAQRQGTIDLMLGNIVYEDTFIDGKTQNFEEDYAATAEHVKLLIEDCKKMLINNPEIVLGSWGLINADATTGDPSETEMDSILILTKDSYYVADYDDQVDKITKYQQVLLSDVDLLESGFPESTNSIFKSSKSHYSIRLSYRVNGAGGYYHMFRSTNLRFFNNMAVAIKNEDEEIESMKAVCESFLVALNIKRISDSAVDYISNKKLDKRKSKVMSTNSHGMYLDIVGLPQITRNVSETQLLALKNAGSKALSNVTQQFSKLGSSLKPRARKPRSTPRFTIGGGKNATAIPSSGSTNANADGKGADGGGETSSDSDEDYENSIFQPNVSVESRSTYHTDSTGSSADRAAVDAFMVDETAMECREDGKVNEAFLESVGIVMGDMGGVDHTVSDNSRAAAVNRLSQVDNLQLASIIQNVSLATTIPKAPSPNPEIQITSEAGEKNQNVPPNTLKLDRTHSHSTGAMYNNPAAKSTGPVSEITGQTSGTVLRSNSERDVASLNISQSQSESALKHRLESITSPVANVTRDLVLSPFSKIAKGVQSLGANLDPRKMSTGGTPMVRQITDKEYEEHRKLQEKWRACKTRLIAL